MEHINRRKFTEKKEGEEKKYKVEEFHLANFASLGSLASNQRGAWYAEAVDRAVIKKLEKKLIKYYRVLKNSAEGGEGEICNG